MKRPRTPDCSRCAALETTNLEQAKLIVELTRGIADHQRASVEAVRKMIATGSELNRERAKPAPPVARPQAIQRGPFKPRRDPEAEFAASATAVPAPEKAQA